MTLQRYHIGGEVWESEADPSTPVYLAGPHLYQIASVGGAIRPYGDEHIRGKMGGAWAHPVRALHGWSLAIERGGAASALEAAERCDLYASHASRSAELAGVRLTWDELVPDEAPALVSIVTLRSAGAEPWAGALLLRAELDMRGCWFSGWPAAVPAPEADGALLSYGGPGPYAERGAAIQGPAGAAWQAGGGVATMRLPLELAPGEERRLCVALAVAHAGGPQAARALAADLAARAPELLAEKAARCAALDAGMRLATPDPELDQAWALARRTFQLLSADYPTLPPYLLAGLPEYPQLFGCDTEYSAAGLAAAGFGPMIRSTLAALAAYGERGCARIPHEVTTNGRVFNAGNTQETPQFAVACWDYARWTGDLDFVRQMYPLCVEGLEHFEGALHHGQYPTGDGVVERLGMGAAKLDSVCYLFQALGALREMALALGRDEEAARFADQAEELRARFERDWWLEAEGVYADSMHLDGRTQLDGHWTVVVPVQVGIASAERAERSLDAIERGWVNEWGLVHTRGAEPRVWTLPTGLLALAALDRGRAELGLRLLKNIAVTSRHGSLGTLKELIPQGICFIQLWSAGLLAQGIAEGLLGLRPEAHRHRLGLRPRLPAGWPAAELAGLRVGEHTLDVRVTPGGARVRHLAGPCDLEVAWGERRASVAPGAEVALGEA